MKLNQDFLAQMREATELLRTSGPAAATEAIQRALGAAVADAAAAHDAHDAQAAARKFIDINPPFDQGGTAEAGRNGLLERLRRSGMPWRKSSATQPVEEAEVHVDAPATPRATPEDRGRFLHGSCANRAGTRAYKLYVPSRYRGEPIPLVVMLHGCKQNPDDFAAGTGMNRLGEQHNCMVLYPAQVAKANGSNCWNWFNPADQQRDSGEPSIIADMTRQVMREYRIDPKRIYVAGLSAGGAMAAIMGAMYPDLYAAVGIHSGLPVGAAHDMASAFGAMNGGHAAAVVPYRQPVPSIVFHGKRDHTVHPGNGDKVLAQCMGVSANAGISAATPGKAEIIQGKTAHGRTYRRSVFLNDDGRAIAEYWEIHGSGHAWSGGSKTGSYTDPKGPDASSEMMRFFLGHTNKH